MQHHARPTNLLRIRRLCALQILGKYLSKRSLHVGHLWVPVDFEVLDPIN
jgi:hypothetical protein